MSDTPDEGAAPGRTSRRGFFRRAAENTLIYGGSAAVAATSLYKLAQNPHNAIGRGIHSGANAVQDYVTGDPAYTGNIPTNIITSLHPAIIKAYCEQIEKGNDIFRDFDTFKQHTQGHERKLLMFKLPTETNISIINPDVFAQTQKDFSNKEFQLSRPASSNTKWGLSIHSTDGKTSIETYAEFSAEIIRFENKEEKDKNIEAASASLFENIKHFEEIKAYFDAEVRPKLDAALKYRDDKTDVIKFLNNMDWDPKNAISTPEHGVFMPPDVAWAHFTQALEAIAKANPGYQADTESKNPAVAKPTPITKPTDGADKWRALEETRPAANAASPGK